MRLFGRAGESNLIIVLLAADRFESELEHEATCLLSSRVESKPSPISFVVIVDDTDFVDVTSALCPSAFAKPQRWVESDWVGRGCPLLDMSAFLAMRAN